jgi:ABC-2 type transport system permease protein
MIQALRRKISIYGAIAALVPKLFLAYSLWVWMEFFVQILAMTIFVYFWRAVYSGSSQIGGLSLNQTINYILLAQILVPTVQNRMILNFGGMMREGLVGIELLRPVDFENRFYVDQLTNLGLTLVLKLPLVIIAWLFFGLRLPSDPAVWGVFFVSLLLGHAVLFCFDWIFSCLAFYSTETWGLSVVREAVAGFFSGAFLPVTMMPLWLQDVTQAMPFAQALYVPISFLSGIHTVADAPRLWLVQIAWLVGLGLLSRLVFNLAVRKVTVQGG